MFDSQIWGTGYMKKGAEVACPLQTGHLCFLKRVLGVERTSCNWSVLRECGQEPLQFYWFGLQCGNIRLLGATVS